MIVSFDVKQALELNREKEYLDVHAKQTTDDGKRKKHCC